MLLKVPNAHIVIAPDICEIVFQRTENEKGLEGIIHVAGREIKLLVPSFSLAN